MHACVSVYLGVNEASWKELRSVFGDEVVGDGASQRMLAQQQQPSRVEAVEAAQIVASRQCCTHAAQQRK